MIISSVLCVHKEPKASPLSARAKNPFSFTENNGLGHILIYTRLSIFLTLTRRIFLTRARDGEEMVDCKSGFFVILGLRGIL